ncbi:MAG: biopolymer transporter ExbD [Rhodocyclales bacterium]|nr:biopolymer transporter ExbD [Rhodocyclales bacterium]
MPVDLPRVDATRIDDKPQVLAVAIDGDGKVFVDGVVQHRSALPEVFAAAMVNGREPELHLRADRGTRYERVTEVLAEAQRAGIVKIAFVTEPAR